MYIEEAQVALDAGAIALGVRWGGAGPVIVAFLHMCMLTEVRTPPAQAGGAIMNSHCPPGLQEWILHLSTYMHFINIYAHDMGAPKYIKQILTDIKGEIDRNTIIVGDFNTPLTSMDRSSRQKINQATEILNNTIEQLDLIDIFRTLHPKLSRIHILFKCT